MTDAPFVVLFVCTANICRSAYAHIRAEQLLADTPGVRVVSAGTHGFLDHPLDDEMSTQAWYRGADPQPFRSRPLSTALVQEADLILTAEGVHRRYILENWPTALPKTFVLGQFAEAVNAAPPDLRGADLIAEARARRTPVQSRMNVPDPYRRGPRAAAACAAQIDGLLEQILPRLAA